MNGTKKKFNYSKYREYQQRYHSEWYKANKQKVKEYCKEYYKANRERILKRMKAKRDKEKQG